MAKFSPLSKPKLYCSLLETRCLQSLPTRASLPRSAPGQQEGVPLRGQFPASHHFNPHAHVADISDKLDSQSEALDTPVKIQIGIPGSSCYVYDQIPAVLNARPLLLIAPCFVVRTFYLCKLIACFFTNYQHLFMQPHHLCKK